MRCERCGQEVPRITKLRGERQFVCLRCRAELERQGLLTPRSRVIQVAHPTTAQPRIGAV